MVARAHLMQCFQTVKSVCVLRCMTNSLSKTYPRFENPNVTILHFRVTCMPDCGCRKKYFHESGMSEYVCHEKDELKT